MVEAGWTGASSRTSLAWPEGSTWYQNTTTVAPYTQLAVPALLTGNYPRDSDPKVDPATFPNSLFTLLGRAYEMNVHESATDLCPVELCPVQGVEDFDHALVAGEEFVQSLQATDAPRLDFMHLLMPHQPWHYLPTGQDYLKVDPAEGAPRYSWTTDHGAPRGQAAPPPAAPGGRQSARAHPRPPD